jgi:hypothetical protein
MTDSVTDLLALCVAARLSGDDFSAIWNNILKGHLLVLGAPLLHADGIEPYLAIQLSTGQQLLLNSIGFSVR